MAKLKLFSPMAGVMTAGDAVPEINDTVPDDSL
jgi:hypothetical protein